MMTRFLQTRRPEGFSQRSGAAPDEASLSQNPPSAPNSEASTSQPQTPIPHRTITSTPDILRVRANFSVSWNNLWLQGKKLKNPRLRPVTKQSLARTNSYVWAYGIELEAEKRPRIWLCKICYTNKDWHHGVYVATSTGGIQAHLASRHAIEDPEPLLPPRSPYIQADEEEKDSTHCSECGKRRAVDFEAGCYKQQYID